MPTLARPNPQLQSDAVLCAGCDHTTHCQDRYCTHLPQQKRPILKWHKFSPYSGAPTNHECYMCFDTRRYFVDDDGRTLSQAQLKASRQADPEVEAQFQARRGAKARGDKKFKTQDKCCVAKTRTVEKGDEDFVRDLEQGTLMPLVDFVARHSCPAFEDDDDLAEYVRQQHGLVVRHNKFRQYVVEVPDEMSGAQRYERGSKTSVASRKTEEYKDKATMLERNEQLSHDVLGPRSRVSGKTAPANRGLLVPKAASVLSARPPVAATDVLSEPAPASPMAAESTTSGDSARTLTFGATRTPSRLPRCGSSDGLVASTTKEARGSNKRAALDLDEEADDDGTAASLALSRSVEQKLSPVEKTLKRGRDLLLEASKKASPENLWARQVRKRELESFLSRCGTLGAQCGGLVGCEAASALSEQLFSLFDDTETLSSLFAAFRDSPLQAVQHISNKRLRTLQQVSISLLAQICSTLTESMVSMSKDPGHFRAAMAFTSCATSDGRLTLHILASHHDCKVMML